MHFLFNRYKVLKNKSIQRKNGLISFLCYIIMNNHYLVAIQVTELMT